MLKNGWNGTYAFWAFGIFSALMLGYVLWEASAEQQRLADSANYASARVHVSAQEDFQNCLRAPNAFDCMVAAAKSSVDAETAQYDLAAQQEIAHWTPWALLTSVIASLAAGIGAVYLYINNNISKAMGEAQVRSYLSFDRITAAFNFDSVDHKVVFQPIFRNTGSSPATVTFAGVDVQWRTAPASYISLRLWRQNSQGHNMRIGADGERRFDSAPIPLTDVKQKIDNGYSSYVAGKICYDDDFGRSHEEAFCVVTRFAGPIPDDKRGGRPGVVWDAFANYTIQVIE